jgi:protein OS-9
MRMQLWALPAALQVAVCSQHAFSVFDDVLAFPQYQVSWPDSAVTDDEAVAVLAGEQDRTKLEPTAAQEQHEAVVLHGQRYLCSVPVVAAGADNLNTTTAGDEAQADTAGELVRARERGWELLEGMRGQCIYYLSGWWSYSFCYQDEVRQFHQLPPTRGVAVYPPREDPTVHSYILGRFPSTSKPASPDGTGSTGSTDSIASTGKTLGSEPDYTPDSHDHAPRLESRGATRYMAQRLPDGTPCDLTGRPRTVDVHFHCNPASPDRIALIKETSTCAYLIVIDTPRLCHDAAFLPPQHNLAHPVACRPVVSAAHVADVALDPLRDHPEHDLANTNPLRDLTDGLEGSTRRRPVIGGIEVGAHALVGSEGKVIEKSVIVGGGKEVYVATVANSEGHQMAKDEMKKLGIRDPADVDEFKANVKRVAGSKAWKLDLVDTPRGREFRGIIETEDSDKLEGEAKGDTKAKAKGDTKPHDTPVTRGSGSGSGSSSDASTLKEQQTDADDDGEEESHSGTEEVYKDEL